MKENQKVQSRENKLQFMRAVVREDKYDVVVVGGGPAGVCAAIASARSGANTLLVEQYGFLGGMATAAMFQPWRGFHTFGKQLVNGIGEEIVKRLQSLDGSSGHLLDPTGISFTVTPFDIEILKFALQNMVVEEKVNLLFHSQFLNAEMAGPGIGALRVHCREGDVSLSANVFVDATGNGTIAASAGASHIKHEATISYRFSMTNVDEKLLLDYVQKNPHEFSGSSSTSLKSYLSVKGFSSLTKKWINVSPELAPFDSLHIDGTMRSGEAVVSMIHLPNVDATNVESLTRAEMRCQKLAPKAAKFLVDNCPGFSSARILTTPPQVGFHSTRQICGAVTISESDVVSGRTFSDAVATCAVPGRTNSTFQISKQTLFVPRIENLLVCGRTVLPPTALFATNNQPASMLLGEVAGKIAAEINEKLGMVK